MAKAGVTEKVKNSLLSIVAVYWQEAVFSYGNRFPKEKPPLDHVAFGILIEENKNKVIVGMNCRYDKNKKEITKCIDTLLTPRKTVTKINKLVSFNFSHNEK